MEMNVERRGAGKPLLLIHGLGGSWKSWSPIIDEIAKHREVIAIDLPGHGKTPPLPGKATVGKLADAVTSFLEERDLLGIDAVGSSMGARLVLELVRRGNILGAVVSLDPGGFWRGLEVPYFYSTIALSIRLIRLLKPAIPALAKRAAFRSLLLVQFSAHPAKLPPQLVRDELNAYIASPSFNELLRNLAYGERQKGMPANSLAKPLVIGWGTKDRVCFPRQAARAIKLFPDAKLHWFSGSGHFPHWDKPKETVALILKTIEWKKQDVGDHFYQ